MENHGPPGPGNLKALLETSFPETQTLKFVSRGKVRDLYEIKDVSPGPGGEGDGGSGSGEEYLLFVATDRISAFDVVLKNGVPGKGALLTQLSVFWFNRLAHILPNHLVVSSLEEMPAGVREQIAQYWEGGENGDGSGLKGRTLLVRKAKVVKLEAIVRGYLTGSAWSEYKKSQTVHGIPLPDDLVESAKLPEPLFTPSTKAEQGEHDENISPEQAKALIGEDLYTIISQSAIELFKEASEYALSKGLIIADTKFEFGLIPTSSLSSSSQSVSSPPPQGTPPNPNSNHPRPIKTITLNGTSYTLILIDEALTPDSSRYWSLESYTPGRAQPSFDKQFLRDWLVSAGFRKGFESGPEGRGGEGWEMTEEVVEGTRKRYAEVVRMLIE